MDFAQLILGTLKTPPHCMQVVLFAVPHCRKRRGRGTNKLVILKSRQTLDKNYQQTLIRTLQVHVSGRRIFLTICLNVGAATQGGIKPHLNNFFNPKTTFLVGIKL